MNALNESITSKEIERRIPMTAEEKIALNERNIRQAIEDYGHYTYDHDVLEDVSDTFIKTVAHDNYYAKQELRELFRKSPVWNEELDAIVINGTRTHDPDYDRVHQIACDILQPVATDENARCLRRAIRFFSYPDADPVNRAMYLESLNELAPGAYVFGKKLTRVFRDLCKALGVADEAKGSEFQKLYARFADELQSKQIPYKLFVSINPAHWITMSNPKRDSRGTTLTSCHSFNSTDYQYNNGCSGYARDKYSFICFTVDDPDDSELLNNRKTTRQIFVYKPGSGLLLQSRMYDTMGGTCGVQPLSKDYRDLIQRELSELEAATNLWTTKKYLEQGRFHFHRHDDFGGYPDWEYSDFVPMLSVRTDAANPEGVIIGEAGVCIKCGEYTSHGVYCECCDNGGCVQCENCGDWYDEDDMTVVHDPCGNEIQVCPHCLDRHYVLCNDCEEYFYEDDVTRVGGGYYVCESCLENYIECDYCGDYEHLDDMVPAVDRDGNEVSVCFTCARNHYSECDDCGRLVQDDIAETAYDADGCELIVCPDCIDSHFTQCEACGHYVSEVEDGICEACREERESA